MYRWLTSGCTEHGGRPVIVCCFDIGMASLHYGHATEEGVESVDGDQQCQITEGTFLLICFSVKNILVV